MSLAKKRILGKPKKPKKPKKTATFECFPHQYIVFGFPKSDKNGLYTAIGPRFSSLLALTFTQYTHPVCGFVWGHFSQGSPSPDVT